MRKFVSAAVWLSVALGLLGGVTSAQGAEPSTLFGWSCELAVDEFGWSEGAVTTGTATCSSPWSSQASTSDIPVTFTVDSSTEASSCQWTASGVITLSVADSVGDRTDRFTLSATGLTGTLNVDTGAAGAVAFDPVVTAGRCTGNSLTGETATFTGGFQSAEAAVAKREAEVDAAVPADTSEVPGVPADLSDPQAIADSVTQSSPACNQEVVVDNPACAVAAPCLLSLAQRAACRDPLWERRTINKPGLGTNYKIEDRHHYNLGKSKAWNNTMPPIGNQTCVWFRWAEDPDGSGGVKEGDDYTGKHCSAPGNAGDKAVYSPPLYVSDAWLTRPLAYVSNRDVAVSTRYLLIEGRY